MEYKLAKATTFRRDSKSEIDFLVNIVNVKQDLLGQTNSPDTVLCMEALGSERFSRSLSLPILSDIEDKDRDEELGKDEKDYSSGDLDENEVITCTLNKEAEDEIDRLTGKFKSFVMKTIYGETGVLHDGTTRVEKDLKLKIAMIVLHCNSISSNSYSHRSSYEGRKSLILEPTNSCFESGKTVDSKEIETPQNDLGHSKLPLPPRLREASYRNPLRLSSPRKDLIEFPPPSCFEELFAPKESLGRNSMQSALSKIVKKQKEISVKLWRSSLDFIPEYGKFPRHPCCVCPHFPRHPCRRPAGHRDTDCRSLKWIQSLQLKLRSRLVNFMQCQRTFCVSRRTLSNGT